jgi:hypothetical protein
MVNLHKKRNNAEFIKITGVNFLKNNKNFEFKVDPREIES